MSLTPEEQNELKALLQDKNVVGSLSGDKKWSQWQGIASNLGKGAALNFDDEIYAGATAPFVDQNYDQQLEGYRRDQNEWNEANPGKAVAAQIAGGVGAAFVPGLNVAKAATAGGAIGRGAVTGGALAGAAGFGAGEGLEDRVTTGVVSAPLGVALGAAVPFVASKFNAKNAIKSDAKTAKQLNSALEETNIADLPPGQKLLQSGGQKIENRAERIVTRQNEGGMRIAQEYDTQKSKLGQDLQDYFGDIFREKNTPEIKDQLKKIAYAKADPAFKAAYDANPKISDPEVNKILDRVYRSGDWGNVTKAARKIAAHEDRTFGNLSSEAVDGVKPATSWSLQDLHYIGKAIRDNAMKTEGGGAFGGKTQTGAAEMNTAKDLLGRLKDISPEFRSAMAEYADDVTIDKAFEKGMGANLFSKTAKQDIFDYKKLPETAQKAWKIGFAENIYKDIRNNPVAAMKRYGNEQFKKLSKDLFESEDQYNKFFAELDARSAYHDRLNKITQGSPSARRLYGVADDTAGDNDAAKLAGMAAINPKLAVLDVARKTIGDQVTKRFAANQAKSDNAIADVLLSTPMQLAGKSMTKQPVSVTDFLAAGMPLQEAKKMAARQALQKMMIEGGLSKTDPFGRALAITTAPNGSE
jgi:hypothetical protein